MSNQPSQPQSQPQKLPEAPPHVITVLRFRDPVVVNHNSYSSWILKQTPNIHCEQVQFGYKLKANGTDNYTIVPFANVMYVGVEEK